MIRLLPAYFFIVLACAVGMFFISDLGAKQYFCSSGFWEYLIANFTFLNFLKPTLPGVFTDLDIHAINGSLWMLKVEWLLYLSVPLCVWFVSKIKNRATLTFVAIYIISVFYRILFKILYDAYELEIYNILGRQVFGQLSFFYSGVLIYYWFDVFKKYRWMLMTVALILMALSTQSSYMDIIFAPFSFSVLAIGLSMFGKWGTWEYNNDNVSYNMYLVHFPICNLAAYFGLRSLTGVWGCFIIFFLPHCYCQSLLIAVLKSRYSMYCAKLRECKKINVNARVADFKPDFTLRSLVSSRLSPIFCVNKY